MWFIMSKKTQPYMSRTRKSLTNKKGDGLGQIMTAVLLILMAIGLIINSYAPMGKSTKDTMKNQVNSINNVNNAIKPGS